MTFRKFPIAFLAFALGVAPYAHARKMPKYEQARQLTPEQAQLVDRAIQQEKVLIKNIRQRTPLVETYIQNTKPDQELYEVPTGDTYVLSRVDFGKTFFDKTYEPMSAKDRLNQESNQENKSKLGFFKNSLASITSLTKLLGLERFTYSPTGFMQMMFIDPSGFDQSHYVFSYVRREFLGSVRTWVFDVHPKVSGMGRFYGRIWIEDQGGNVVRFNGTYTGPDREDSSKYYFHFDSWRMNVQPDLWLPVAIYVEETQRIEGTKIYGLKAQTHFWGYSLKLPTADSENVNIRVEDAVDQSNQSQDIGPLQASRMWITQAEDNVLDRLEQAGLVAPLVPGGFENKVLDQIVINLVVPNNLAFPEPIHTRIMLTDTIEATTVGNTILLSKGLIDTLPNEESIASVIAMELAHIAMGHHIDTRYAFNDRLLFPDEQSFQRIDMYHSDHDNTEAAKRAMEYLQNSMYKDRLADAGLYYEDLVARENVLKALNTPKLGDSLLQANGTPWMVDLEKMAPKIDWNNLTQPTAYPLGSWLKTDPWDDTEHMLNYPHYAPMNARDKMPFEVTPIFYRLQPYETAAAQTPAAPGTPAQGDNANQAPANGAAAPAAAPADNAQQPAPPANAAAAPADNAAPQQAPAAQDNGNQPLPPPPPQQPVTGTSNPPPQ